MRLRVQGGPADGATAAPNGFLRWLSPDGQGHGQPAPGRALYKRSGGHYVFTGFRAWSCACGALVVERVDGCPLCGQSRQEGVNASG